MAFDAFSAVAGVAGGWAAQWLLVDRPFLRKIPDAANLVSTGTATDSGASAKLDACQKECQMLKDQIAGLKGELEQTHHAFGSAKTEIASLRAAQPNDGDIRDDLEEIDGIGPVFERKLYDAKVFTFKQLSEMSAAAITDIIKPQNWQKIEPEKWIAEARTFANRGK